MATYNFTKRFFDILISISIIVISLPILFLTAFSILIFLGRPIFFLQERSGLNGKPFTIFKFRTMGLQKDIQGNSLSDKARLTAFGKLLRSLSLDELPQLFNVIKGNMSLVGPRPLYLEYNSLYNDTQKKRLTILPGLTGWAQINGRNNITWEQKFDLDIWYLSNRTFILDFKIIVKTFFKIFHRKDITSQNSVSMEPFKGSPSK